MIALDIETSGLDPTKHSIVSLGAVDLDDPTNQFYDECRVWEGAQVEKEALAVNGFTEEEVTNPSRKSEAELVRAFVAWATDRPKDRTLGAQNVSFDYEFLRNACERAKSDFPFARRSVDVHTLAWGHMRYRGIEPPVDRGHSALSSSEVLAYCGLPPEAKPHNALSGALWHAEVIGRMAYNRKILPDFEMHDIPWMTP